MPSGSVRVRHREYLADQLGSVAFSSSSFAINPGLSRSFPWLSRVASRFESYHFESLRFLFETEAPTTATGSVIMTVDYDPEDAAPLSKTAALAYEGAVRSAPWSHSEFRARREDLSKRKSYFVRCGNLSDGRSLSLHDTGNLFVCVKGQATAAVVGEIYVEYDIILMTPQLEPSVQSAQIVSGGTVSNAAPFGSAPEVTGCLDVTVSGDTMTFNSAGEQLFAVSITGTGVALPTTSSSTCSVTQWTGTVNAAATLRVNIWRLRFSPGDTFVMDCTGSTTVTATSSKSGEYQYTL